MNTYLAETIAAQRITDLRREADAMRLAARATRHDVDADLPRSGHIRRSLLRAVATLLRRTAPVASL